MKRSSATPTIGQPCFPGGTPHAIPPLHQCRISQDNVHVRLLASNFVIYPDMQVTMQRMLHQHEQSFQVSRSFGRLWPTQHLNQDGKESSNHTKAYQHVTSTEKECEQRNTCTQTKESYSHGHIRPRNRHSTLKHRRICCCTLPVTASPPTSLYLCRLVHSLTCAHRCSPARAQESPTLQHAHLCRSRQPSLSSQARTAVVSALSHTNSQRRSATNSHSVAISWHIYPASSTAFTHGLATTPLRTVCYLLLLLRPSSVLQMVEDHLTDLSEKRDDTIRSSAGDRRPST